MRRLRFAVAALAGAVLTAIAIPLILASDHDDNKLLVATVAVTAGATMITAGLVALWRRPENATGLYLAATGYLWFLGALGESNDDWAWTIGMVIGNLSLVVFVALILAYPDGLLTRRDVRLVLTGGVLAIGGNLVAALVDETPTGCSECPRSAIALTDSESVTRVASPIVSGLVMVVLALVVATLIGRWRSATPARRRLLTPVYLACATSLALLIVTVVTEGVSEGGYTLVWVLFLVSFVAVPLTFLMGVLRTRRTTAGAATALLGLGAGADVRRALADALGDPTLEIAYWMRDGQVWADADGRPVDASPWAGRSAHVIESDGEPVALIFHDSVLDLEPSVVHAAAAAARFPLENARLHADLRAQLDFLGAFADTAPSLLLRLDRDGRIRNQNRAAVAAAGFDDEEELRGTFFVDCFADDDDRVATQPRVVAAADGFTPGSFALPFTNRRGDRLVIEWTTAAVTRPDGTVDAVVAGGLDVTERTAYEQRLVAERDFLFVTSRATPSLLTVIDGEGRIDRELGVNKAFWERGLSDQEASGQLVWDVVTSDEDEAGRAQMRDLVLAAIVSGSTADHDSVWRIKGGEPRNVSWSCRVLGELRGRQVYLVCGQDVTDRVEREHQLQRERDITETLMRAIPSVVVVVDRRGKIVDSGVDGTRAGVNDAFRETFGWRDEDLVRRSFLDLVVDDDGSADAAIRKAAAGERAGPVESDWRRQDGTLVGMEWSARPVQDVTERTEGLLLVAGTDVTDRQAHEAGVRASRARIIAAGDDARRVLERNLHDGAQQRLVALSVSLRLAESKLGTDPVGAKTLLTGARDELAQALEELRELARGIHPAVLTDRGLGPAIEALVIRSHVPVGVDVSVGPLEPAVEAAVYYVVAEALTNVAKYARASHATVRVTQEDGRVIATVADDGVGGADASAGTGLRGLGDRLAALDGTLSVESPPGGGTSVRAEIPVPRTATAS